MAAAADGAAVRDLPPLIPVARDRQPRAPRGAGRARRVAASRVRGQPRGAHRRADPGAECRTCHMPLEEAPLGDAAAKGGKHPLASLRRREHLAGVDARRRGAARARVQAMLRGAASIDVAVATAADGTRTLPADGAPVRAGRALVFDVVVRNERTGHRFPGGVLDAQDTWIELVIEDARGGASPKRAPSRRPGRGPYGPPAPRGPGRRERDAAAPARDPALPRSGLRPQRAPARRGADALPVLRARRSAGRLRSRSRSRRGSVIARAISPSCEPCAKTRRRRAPWPSPPRFSRVRRRSSTRARPRR